LHRHCWRGGGAGVIAVRSAALSRLDAIRSLVSLAQPLTNTATQRDKRSAAQNRRNMILPKRFGTRFQPEHAGGAKSIRKRRACVTVLRSSSRLRLATRNGAHGIRHSSMRTHQLSRHCGCTSPSPGCGRGAREGSTRLSGYASSPQGSGKRRLLQMR